MLSPRLLAAMANPESPELRLRYARVRLELQVAMLRGAENGKTEMQKNKNRIKETKEGREMRQSWTAMTPPPPSKTMAQTGGLYMLCPPRVLSCSLGWWRGPLRTASLHSLPPLQSTIIPAHCLLGTS